MKKFALWFIGVLVCALVAGYFYFVDKEFVITIPEQKILEKLEEKLPFSKSYFVIFAITLDKPRLDLSPDSDRIKAGLDIELNIKIGEQEKPLGGTVDASGALLYQADEGAFYLTDLAIEHLELQGVPEKYNGKVTATIEKALTAFYATRPVYKLNPLDTKQATAKLVLKDVQIRQEAVVVTLGL